MDHEDYYRKVADDNGFQTSWCIKGVTDFKKNSPWRGQLMEVTFEDYTTLKAPLPDRILTWLDLWRIIDAICRLNHSDVYTAKWSDGSFRFGIAHKFIESIERKRRGVLTFSMGS